MRTILLQVVLGLILIYFAYHALAGDQGLARWTQLQKTEKTLIAEREELILEKTRLEDRITRLQAESMDLDYVEELARRKLAYARKNEIILTQ